MKKYFTIFLLIFSCASAVAQNAINKTINNTAIRTMDGNTIELNTSATRLSENGHFKVTAKNLEEPIEINHMHAWILHIEDINANNVESALISIDGGMPEHNHGLPTAPRVTKHLGAGDYLVEGMRFNMGGWWELRFIIDATGTTDMVLFNRILAQ